MLRATLVSRLLRLALTTLMILPRVITSVAAALAIDENSGADQVIYTATSDDSADFTEGVTTYSLAPKVTLPCLSIPLQER